MLSEKQRAALATIPKIYLQQGFNLENVDTFNAVFPWSQIETVRQNPTSGTKTQLPKLLQEKVRFLIAIKFFGNEIIKSNCAILKRLYAL